MTILTVRHITTYRYQRPVAFGEHRMMFRPRDSYDQRLNNHGLISLEPTLRIKTYSHLRRVARGSSRRASEFSFENNIWLNHYPSMLRTSKSSTTRRPILMYEIGQVAGICSPCLVILDHGDSTLAQFLPPAARLRILRWP